MKKLVLLFVCTLFITSCDVDDDGPRLVPVLAEVVDADFPEFFEVGETYEINITYLLPDACHQPLGLEVKRGGPTGDEYRDIYVAGVAQYDANLAVCAEEDDDLEEVEELTITIDKEEPYTFYLWTGVDDDNEFIYTVVEVPVGAPEEVEGE